MNKDKIMAMWEKLRDKIVATAKKIWSNVKRFFTMLFTLIVEFAYNNPAEAAGIVASAAVIAKKSLSAHRINAEDRRRRLDMYDPRKGEHVILRKPLTARQKIEVDKRYMEDRSESYVHIFDDMGIKFR